MILFLLYTYTTYWDFCHPLSLSPGQTWGCWGPQKAPAGRPGIGADPAVPVFPKMMAPRNRRTSAASTGVSTRKSMRVYRDQSQ